MMSIGSEEIPTFDFQRSPSLDIEEGLSDLLVSPRAHPEEGYRSVESINFFSHTGLLLLGVGGPELIDSIIPQDKLEELVHSGFEPKSEAHVTVLNYENGGYIFETLRPLSSLDRDAVMGSIGQLASRIDWRWRPAGELHPFRRSGRKRGHLKLVTLVECPGVADFYGDLRKMLPGLRLSTYPMHITLMKRPMNISPMHDVRVGDRSVNRPLHTLGGLALGY